MIAIGVTELCLPSSLGQGPSESLDVRISPEGIGIVHAPPLPSLQNGSEFDPC